MPAGRLAATFPLELAAPTMIHDFVLTERHIVLLACPLVFDLEAAMRGQSMLQWKPELGTRIGVIGLDGGSVQWLDAEPFFVFHFANGYEAGGRIVIDYVRHDRLGAMSGDRGAPPMLHRLAIDLAARPHRRRAGGRAAGGVPARQRPARGACRPGSSTRRR